MMNKIFFENGIQHDFTVDELKLLRLLVSEYSRKAADEHCIDIEALRSLKVLFLEHLD